MKRDLKENQVSATLSRFNYKANLRCAGNSVSTFQANLVIRGLLIFWSVVRDHFLLNIHLELEESPANERRGAIIKDEPRHCLIIIASQCLQPSFGCLADSIRKATLAFPQLS